MPEGINAQEFVPDVDPDTLTMWPGNARRGVIIGIKESIRINGFAGSLLVQKSTNRIIAGNHRFQAWQELSRENPERYGKTIPVTYLDVNDKRATKLNLADNKTADDASWDNEALLAQLVEITESDNLMGTGFADDDIEDLQALLEYEDMEDDDLQGALDAADQSAAPVIRIQVEDPELYERWKSVDGNDDYERLIDVLNKSGY